MSLATSGALWSVFEATLVGLIVLVCAVHALRVLWPGAWRRARIACALPLLREGSPRWLRPLGRRLAPAPAINATAACGPCRGCDKAQPTATPALR